MTAKEREPALSPFGMTDLEERFLGPDGERAQQALSARLAELGEAAEREVGAGVAPDRYHELATIRAALAAARAVVLLFKSK